MQRILLYLWVVVWCTRHSAFAASIVSTGLSGKCISIRRSSTESGARVIHRTCDGSEDQEFTFERIRAERNQIKVKHSGLCLRARRRGRDSDRYYVIQAPCQTTGYFLWSLSGTGNNQQVRVSISGDFRCMTIREDDAEIALTRCRQAVNQRFRVGGGGRSTTDRPPIQTTRSKWEGPFTDPNGIIAAAAAHLRNGNILMWSAAQKYDFRNPGNQGKTWTTIFNPNTKRYSQALIQDTNHDMFCPGTAMLRDGRIMITGGRTSAAVTIYSPDNNEWLRAPRMAKRRGYHAMTLLADGSVFNLGGSWSGGVGEKDGEIWSPETNEWTLLSGVDVDRFVTQETTNGQYRSDNHMMLFPAPNGLVFHAGPSFNLHWIDPRGNGRVYSAGRRDDDKDIMNGNAVMYDVGKILTLGGAELYTNSDASRRSYVITITSTSNRDVSVRRVGDMAFPRSMSNSVVLPNREVVVVGGQRRSVIFRDVGAVLEAEIWNPNTERWRTLSKMKVARTYHSIAMILKDGRVLAAGGGLCGDSCGDANHPDAEIFTPPYLLDSDGGLRTRPRIVAISSTLIRLGTTITITMDTTDTHTFSLIRQSAITHTTNNDQRCIPIRGGISRSVSGGRAVYRIRIPNLLNVIIPGPYFMFAMNSAGTPSVAESVMQP